MFTELRVFTQRGTFQYNSSQNHSHLYHSDLKEVDRI